MSGDTVLVMDYITRVYLSQEGERILVQELAVVSERSLK